VISKKLNCALPNSILCTLIKTRWKKMDHLMAAPTLDGRKTNENNKDSQMGHVTPKR